MLNNGVTLEGVLRAARSTKSLYVRVTPVVSGKYITSRSNGIDIFEGPSTTIEGFVLTSAVVAVGAVAAYFYVKNRK